MPDSEFIPKSPGIKTVDEKVSLLMCAMVTSWAIKICRQGIPSRIQKCVLAITIMISASGLQGSKVQPKQLIE
jgi:hypothetical protein